MASTWTGRRGREAPLGRARAPRRAIAWLHRWIGLTLGLVLAVMGTTGSLLAFRGELQSAMTPPPAVAGGARLSLDALVARLEAEPEPGRMLRMLAWSPHDGVVEARYGGDAGDATWLVDPATGARIARPWADAAFWAIERIHRTMALGEPGQWFAFFAAIALLSLAVLGITLRLPLRGEPLARWLSPRSTVRGRPRWRRLHEVAGTWLLPLFACSALTGLFWASDAYRSVLLGLAGEPPRPPRPAMLAPPVRPLPDLSRALAAFDAAAPDATRVVFPVPRDAATGIELRYLAPDAPHERAFGTVKVTPEGALLAHDPFDAQPRGRRALALVYPLHTGSWLGAPGRVLMMTGALALPLLFAVGLYLTLGGRRRTAPAVQR